MSAMKLQQKFNHQKIYFTVKIFSLVIVDYDTENYFDRLQLER